MFFSVTREKFWIKVDKMNKVNTYNKGKAAVKEKVDLMKTLEQHGLLQNAPEIQ